MRKPPAEPITMHAPTRIDVRVPWRRARVDEADAARHREPSDARVAMRRDGEGRDARERPQRDPSPRERASSAALSGRSSSRT